MSAHICYIDKPSTANILVKKLDTAKPAAAGTEDTAATKSADAAKSSETKDKDKVTKSALTAQTEKVGGQLNAQLDESRSKGVAAGVNPDEKSAAQSKLQAQLQQYSNHSTTSETAAPAGISVSA
ncbi:MAG: hypothetical protein M3R60_08945 [Pseudomonadota bacterium]|nr:hypothetical protein [Pseudomonadota bacterium]